MNLKDIKPGLLVRVHTLGSTNGMLIQQHYLDARREGAIGIIDGSVAGHGGDVWWVRHENSSEIGAYVFHEFDIYDGMLPEPEPESDSIFD